MKKIYHLSSCNTCKNYLKELDPPSSFVLQDIKKQPVTEDEVEQMKKLAGSYEDLFNKRARLYRQQHLQTEELTEDSYKNLLLQHYTFLKRPVVIDNDNIFIGHSEKTLEAAKASINE